MNVMNAWKNAIRDIVSGRTFTDDEGRECHEQENKVVTVTELDDIQAPLHWLRGQTNWHLPSDDALKAAMFSLEKDDAMNLLLPRLKKTKNNTLMEKEYSVFVTSSTNSTATSFLFFANTQRAEEH